MKSNSTKETVKVLIFPETKSRTQITFPINDCQIGIEKYEHGTQTIYKARVKNCDGFHKYWYIILLPSGSVRVEWDAFYSYNPKYVKTLTSNDKDTYSIILNNSALKHDGITIRKFNFHISHRLMDSSPDDIAAIYSLIFEI